MISGEEGELNW